MLAERWQRLAPDRQGLTLDKLSRTTGESALYEHVLEAARLLADRADTPTRDQAGVASDMRTGLARCAVDRTEALDEGRRSMPYVGQGSVGIAVVLDGYLGHDDLADQIDRLARYAVPYQGELALPGDQVMRLSMGLDAGTADCLAIT
ncbi:glycoside hydrolase family protein [Actinacidiphila oryziradicis]|uniref:Uncharacterized protein n=1 Tax=Actinacidiphila oryziradicis TaxID=2571141 RepID=A0A4U0T7G9_9ACTN|nr:hypothetical protein [Actinacidiphila oryziradicis]TKA09225.1 hypothetical protein FCI23_24440 [Actinacidiphila oryziradicis]